jgi:Flp pilus assembly protein TadB
VLQRELAVRQSIYDPLDQHNVTNLTRTAEKLDELTKSIATAPNPGPQDLLAKSKTAGLSDSTRALLACAVGLGVASIFFHWIGIIPLVGLIVSAIAAFQSGGNGWAVAAIFVNGIYLGLNAYQNGHLR